MKSDKTSEISMWQNYKITRVLKGSFWKNHAERLCSHSGMHCWSWLIDMQMSYFVATDSDSKDIERIENSQHSTNKDWKWSLALPDVEVGTPRG